jgi:DNA-binding transcriptional LysR family regulator
VAVFRLEREAGAALLEKAGRGVRLTDAAVDATAAQLGWSVSRRSPPAG